MFKRYIILLASIFIPTNQLYSYHTEYLNHVTSKHLMSFGAKPEIELPKPPNIEKRFDLIKTLFKPHNFIIRELSPREKRELTLKASPVQPVEKDNVINEIFIDKLEIVFGSGQNSTDHLITRLTTIKDESGKTIDLLHTQAGKKHIFEILTQPTSDIQTIQNRQALLKELLENNTLLEQCEKILTQAKQAEPLFLQFFTNDDNVNNEIFKKMYWGSLIKSLNSSTAGLEVGTRLNNLKNIIFGFGSLPMSLTLPPLIISKIGDMSYSEAVKIQYNPYKEILANPDIPFGIKVAGASYVGLLLGGSYIFSSLSATADMQLRTKVANYMQKKLIGAANYIHAIKELYSIANQNKCFKTHCHTLKHIESLISLSSVHSDKFNELIYTLDKKTFTGDPSVFSVTGRVLFAYQQMKDEELKKEFAEAINALGELDMLVAVAKKIKHQSTQGIPFTFARFVNSEKPVIKAVNFGNPFIDNAFNVPNSIELGYNEIRNIILTGPNTGGKSTLMKGLMLNIHLAQTIGIVLADDFECSIFTNLNCHMNITDDTTAGVSLFKAEVLQAKELVSMLRNLGSDQYAFIIIDEIFTGTSPDQAESLSYEFLTQLCEFKNCIFIDATHFKKMTELEKSTSVCKNYHMGAITNTEGKIEKYTYTLEQGPSTISNAGQIVSEENR